MGHLEDQRRAHGLELARGAGGLDGERGGDAERTGAHRPDRFGVGEQARLAARVEAGDDQDARGAHGRVFSTSAR